MTTTCGEEEIELESVRDSEIEGWPLPAGRSVGESCVVLRWTFVFQRIIVRLKIDFVALLVCRNPSFHLPQGFV